MMLFLFLFLSTISISQQLFVNESNTSFFSSAPLEDISAISNELGGVVDFTTGHFFFRIPIKSFSFPSSLMQKHFNEKYLESEKYPISTFKGQFIEKIDMSTIIDDIKINTEGVLNIHGRDQNVIIETLLLKKNEQIIFSSSFNVFLEDFNIKVPKIVRMNIADTILVNVEGSLTTK